MRLLIIIPTHNEATCLPQLFERIPARLGEFAVHCLVVDDDSRDGTREWIKVQPEFDQRLFLIERPRKLGLGTAYVEGFKWALARDYQRIFEMDADLSHDPAALPEFMAEIDRGADLVLGSRYVNGVRVLNWPISRLLLSVFAAIYVQTLTRMPFSDPTGGFKCFRRSVLESIDLAAIRSNGYAFQIEMTHCAWLLNFKIAEVPIIFTDRREGSSKMSTRIAREAAFQVIRLGLRGLLGIRPASQ